MGFAAWLKLLPQLIPLLIRVLKYLNLVDDPAKFIKDSGEVFDRLEKSKTPKEKSDAAKGIQDLIGRL